MKDRSQEQFKLVLITLHVIAAFIWGYLLRDYFPIKATPQVLGVSDTNIIEAPVVYVNSDDFTFCNSVSDCTVINPQACGFSSESQSVVINNNHVYEYLNEIGCDIDKYNASDDYDKTDIILSCISNKCGIELNNSFYRTDFDLDGQKDIDDYAIFLREFLDCKDNDCNSFTTDLNGDNYVTIQDFYYFLEYIKEM